MKKSLILVFALSLFSCSSDDDSIKKDSEEAANYLPLNPENYWVYNVSSSGVSEKDSLYVNEIIEFDGKTYNTFTTENQNPKGFYSEMMSNGKHRISETKLLMTGEFNIEDVFQNVFQIPSLELTDFVLFDSDASQGNVLDSKTAEFTVPYNEMDIKAEYTLSTSAGQIFDSYITPEGKTYQYVKSVQIKVKAKVDISMDFSGFPITYPILNNQDIIVSTFYYAKNIGVVYANTTIKYQLNELPVDGLELPIPENYNSTTEENLDNYLIE